MASVPVDKDSADQKLQFAPFSSALEAGFWHQLTQKKLNDYRLDDSPKNIKGYYYNGDPVGLPTRLTLEFSAFEADGPSPARCCPVTGTLYNTNTLEAFKTSDKKALLEKQATEIWDSIQSGDALKDPSLLCKFLLLTYADLKKYHFYYWFCFPALCFSEGIKIIKEPATLEQVFSSKQTSALQAAYDSLCSETGTSAVPYFLIKYTEDAVQVAQLRDWDSFNTDLNKVTVGVYDPCTLPQHPGWPLRNLLFLLASKWGSPSPAGGRPARGSSRGGYPSSGGGRPAGVVRQGRRRQGVVLQGSSGRGSRPAGGSPARGSSQEVAGRGCLRGSRQGVVLQGVTVSEGVMPSSAGGHPAGVVQCGEPASSAAFCSTLPDPLRMLLLYDVAPETPQRPDLNLLFSHQSRTLARAVYSDVVSCHDKQDAWLLELIGVILQLLKNAEGHVMSIPMPGHPVNFSEATMSQARQDVEHLEKLISQHDVVFLLMDTRESRWLPTVIAASNRKVRERERGWNQ
ncbi:ubiquitin-like modifier-activating enzyme ATG7, partial [Salvelinus sp. IW2-2015]|uniref:ubiquitin-like modifier-activating enzyme ATG7 n=1 Tax=Salvelinus sp. IW2-2015 TaxID=2691554 RepID=UPI0038D35B54